MFDTARTSDTSKPSDTARRLAQQVRVSTMAIVLLAGTALGATTISPITGAVIANGSVVVEGNLRKVQHPTGGTIGTLNVHEGMLVREGDLMLRLDDTATRANLAIIVNQLMAASARRTRLLAERDNSPDLTEDAAAKAHAADPVETARVLAGERHLLEARRATRAGQKAQLLERIEQLKEEARGATMQLESLKAQREIAALELKDLQGLLDRHLIQRPRVTQIRREMVRIDGAIGELTARRAQVRGRISETQLQILQIDTDQTTEIARDLREVETKITELIERRMAAEDLLTKVDVRAPITGQVHQLGVHTVGGVVTPGETMLKIVPANDALVIEARIDPIHIDEVRRGQSTRIRFSAFNFSTTPEVEGSVVRIAGDLTRDAATGVSYYAVTVRVSPDEIDRLQGLQLLPGMPAEVYLTTTQRTIASFLIKPLLDHMDRSFRES